MNPPESALCRVLIVDDEPSILQALRRELLRKPDIAHDGLEIEAFSSPLEALKRIGQPDGQFDIALVDYRMPELNGISLLAEFHHLWPSAARILITGEMDADVALRAINEAAVDFLVIKPWFEFDLKGCMAMALKEAALRRRLQGLTLPARTEPYRLVLIDDDPGICTSLAREIVACDHGMDATRPCFEISAFANALDALAALSICPDLVISDQMMPGMDGITFLRRVREQCPDTVRVMLSGHTDLELLVRAANVAGVFHFLKKPWSAAELAATVGHALIYRDLLAAAAASEVPS